MIDYYWFPSLVSSTYALSINWWTIVLIYIYIIIYVYNDLYKLYKHIYIYI